MHCKRKPLSWAGHMAGESGGDGRRALARLGEIELRRVTLPLGGSSLSEGRDGDLSQLGSLGEWRYEYAAQLLDSERSSYGVEPQRGEGR
jgi:hypothetical protein